MSLNHAHFRFSDKRKDAIEAHDASYCPQQWYMGNALSMTWVQEKRICVPEVRLGDSKADRA